ncbi:MAG: HIT domain-containing protein, partial [Nitrosopumilaceae archaeon]|nr:HIT domain-containing protein [Nitrosopumilaceae archaeon]NIU01353.1 HIT domain-containing protein [Nitrosopumilaceae archaeon]NIU87697.1 HIT domain-containing protein [Nitrosopumilaceae archaeon]NIV66093.1 HIT domain-containing protein [Nitrosopumilaceae archaeon]NIX61955.1 HIT domain-containing protein [Nitrosopumilaceae archaeon]
CIFCKIIKKEIPTNIISETADSMAFLDAFPLAKGHTLVIPKKHRSKIQEMTDAENSDLFNLVHKTIAKVDSITGATLVAI